MTDEGEPHTFSADIAEAAEKSVISRRFLLEEIISLKLNYRRKKHLEESFVKRAASRPLCKF